MNRISRNLLAVSALTVAAALPCSAALAQQAATPTTTPAAGTNGNAVAQIGVTAVDAGKLIGENVYDSKGDNVGTVDSVIVDTNGKVSSVVLDIGGWLSADKRISLPWKDLKSDADGKITTSLTKEEAQAATSYEYKAPTSRGKVLGESGEPYNIGAASNNTSGDTGSAMGIGTPVRNADGSLNASEVIGIDVRNPNDDSIGKVKQLVLDRNGNVKGVVVDVGGFLGIGAHPVLLQWQQLQLSDHDGRTEAVVGIDKETLKQMPAYKS